MHERVSRLAARFRRVLEDLKQRSKRWWIVVLAVGFILEELLRSWLSDSTLNALRWIWRGIEWLVGQPVGYVGLLLALYVVVLIAQAWWATRPARGPDKNSTSGPPPIPEEDRRAIQDIRTAWVRHGREPVRRFAELMGDVSHAVANRYYWGDLLRPIAAELNRARGALDAVVDLNSQSPLSEVRDRFNELHGAYFAAMKWVARIHANESIQHDDWSLDGRLNEWVVDQRRFWSKLMDLDTDPRHHATMKIYHRFVSDGDYASLLRWFSEEGRWEGDSLAECREQVLGPAREPQVPDSGDTPE